MSIVQSKWALLESDRFDHMHNDALIYCRTLLSSQPGRWWTNWGRIVKKMGEKWVKNGRKMGGIEQRAKWVESSFRVRLLFHAGAGDFPVILPRRHLLQQPSPKTDSTSLLPTSTSLSPSPLAAFIPKIHSTATFESSLVCALLGRGRLVRSGTDSFGNWFQLPTNLFPP